MKERGGRKFQPWFHRTEKRETKRKRQEFSNPPMTQRRSNEQEQETGNEKKKKKIIPIDLAGPIFPLLNRKQKANGGRRQRERNEKGAKKWECNVAH